MKFRVCNRPDIGKWNPVGVPHLIISISTPGDEEAEVRLNEFTVDVLRLSFNDLDQEPGPAFRKVYGEPVLFDEKLAVQIRDFVQANVGRSIKQIVVHCDAGQSRSPAVAAALAKKLNGSDDEFWEPSVMYAQRRYSPNRLVYRVLLDILMGWRRASQLDAG